MKKYNLPFEVSYNPKTANNKVEVVNEYSGEKCELPQYAVAVYDVIKGSELLGEYDTMRKGLDWFQKYFTDEYYVLLD